MQIFIQSFGAKLSTKDGLFEVTTIQNKLYVKHEYTVHEVTSIWVSNACSVTTAAVLLAMENDIDVLLLNAYGKPMGRFLPIRPNSIISIQRAQLRAAEGTLGLTLTKEWIGQKMENQIGFLLDYQNNHRSNEDNKVLINKQIAQIKTYQTSLQAVEGASVAEVAATIRGIEGSAGRAYFSAFRELIPERYNFEKRTYQKSDDFFNTCLNYAYAILYSKVETALVKAGLNPYAGFLHRDEHQHISMVYDFVEPYRAWAEAVVFSLIASKSMTNAYFETSESGALWLSSVGKRYVAAAILEMMKERVLYDVSNQTVEKEHLLRLKAQNLATLLHQNDDCKVLEMQVEMAVEMAVAA